MNVNKEYAALNYYYEENDPGYVSIENNNGLDEKFEEVKKAIEELKLESLEEMKKYESFEQKFWI